MKRVITLLAVAITLPLAAQQKQVYLDESRPIEERVEDALSRMTLEEKVALCHAQSKFSSAGVRRLGIPEVWLSDGPHGVRAEFNWDNWDYANWTNDACTVFPALTALAATWNPELSALYGKSVGEEARYREKDILLGPGVNISRTPLNGRNFEYMGEDPYLTGEMAVPYIQELQKNGVAACVKHFALNNQEKWRDNVNVKVSDRALYEIYLPAFKRAVQEGKAWSVMGAYNRVWDEHCCHNARLLNDILRGEWGFDGVVVSDWGATHDTKQAALNGLDIEMGSYTDGLATESMYGYDAFYLATPYLEMIKRGEIPESTVDDKARNILRLIFRTAMNTDKPFGSMTTPEHYAAAKQVAVEAIVLLKNNGLLPLDPAKYDNVLVVGENAVRILSDGGGSSELKAKDMFTPLEAIRETYGNGVKFAEGYRSGRPFFGWEEIIPDEILDSLHNEAVELAKKADVVIQRGEEVLNIHVTLKEIEVPTSEYDSENAPKQQKLLLGVRSVNAVELDKKELSFFESVKEACSETWDITTATLRGVGQMLTGKRASDDVGGVLRIAEMSGDISKERGLIDFTVFMALLSINLGLINLFPIPVLDGGQAVISVIEMIARREIGEKIKEYMFRFGFGVIMALVVFATWNDLVHLFKRIFV